MLKLELDWSGDQLPTAGESDPDDTGHVAVEFDPRPGPSGWPRVYVYAWGDHAGPAIWAWLVDEYGADEDEASDLASLAESV